MKGKVTGKTREGISTFGVLFALKLRRKDGGTSHATVFKMSR